MKTKKITFFAILLVFVCIFAVYLSAGCSGIDGKDGTDGKSAYEIWLDEGHTGSQADFLEWLKNDCKLPDGGGEQENEWNVGAVPVTASLTKKGEHYTLNISGYGDMKNWTRAEDVPWYEYGESINEIVIGDFVTGIGNYAFANTAVTSLIIPEGIKTVGGNALPEGAFAYVRSSTKVNPEQPAGANVCVYSEQPPETHDRHWTSWGSTGNITDADFADDEQFWHFGNDGKPVLWKKTKVLFIGNSFTFYYQIPKQFDAIAENLGYCVETYSITVPGQTLEAHANPASNSGVQINALLDKINDFDYVVLQEQSTRPYTDYNKFFNAVQTLKQKVDETQRHAKIYLYETWGSPASAGESYEEIAEMEQKLYEAYTQAANDLNCGASYVGRAFTRIKSETDLNLYFGDNRHPGPAGSHLSACVHVASMLGGDVRKTNLSGKDLVVIANEGASAQAMNLSEEQCEILRTAAYKTVFENEGETEKYTVKFWYDGKLQSEKTATVGLGFSLPSCTVTEGEKFSGWLLKNGEKVYAADSRVGYSEIREQIENGVVNFYAQSRETIIAVWGRWITEENFMRVMEGFKSYCSENGYNYDKVGYIYYTGKIDGTDPYFSIANFTGQAAKDDADIVFPCGDNITNPGQSAIANSITESKALGAKVESSMNRYVAKLNEKTLTTAFYEYITTDEAKAILNALN